MFLKSSEIESINGSNYLSVFVEKQFPYIVKHNGDDFEVYEFLFKEPSMEDISDLKKLAVSLEKIHYYENVKTLRMANLFSKNTYDEIKKDKEFEEELQETETIEEEIIKEEDKQKGYIDETRMFLSKVFGLASDYEDENTNYFVEIQKFIDFIEKRCFRRGDNNLLLPVKLSVLDKYKADSYFIKESLVVEFLSFFFDHLPSKSLHMTIKG